MACEVVNAAERRRRESLVLDLGRALHSAGIPAQRLEETLLRVSSALALRGQFFSTPTSLWAGFGEDEDQRVTLARVDPGEINLGRTYLLDDLAGRIARGVISVDAAREELRGIGSGGSGYPVWVTLGAFGLASGAASIFFGGSLVDLLASIGVGLGIGVLLFLTERRRPVARLMDFLAGVAASLSAAFVGAVWETANPFVITLASLIVLVPGLTLTTAIGELAARHLVSGTARLMHALMIFLAIGFGVAVGRAVERAFGLEATARVDGGLDGWWLWVALLVAPGAFTVLFGARRQEYLLITLAGLSSFLGARIGVEFLGTTLGATVGAFALGIFANAYARIARRPSLLLKTPGLMLLVPGSIGFRSVTSLIEADATGGVETAFTMIFVAVSLVAGLLIAEAALPPRQTL